MFEFLRLHGKWVDLSQNGIVLKPNTPQHIVDLYSQLKQEYEDQRRNGVIVD